MGLLSSYPTTTTLDSTDVFPLADTDNKVKTITAPALAAALDLLSGGITDVVGGTDISVTTSGGTATVSFDGSTGGGALSITGGTTTLGTVTSLDFPAGTLTGTSSAATITLGSGGSAGGPIVGVSPSLSVPALSNFTLRSGASGTTLTQPMSSGPIVMDFVTSTGNQMQMATVPAPGSTPWTKSWLLEWDGGLDPNTLTPFIILYNSSTTALIWAGFSGNEAYVQYWSNPTSPGSTIQSTSRGRPTCSAYWFRVTFDGTNLSFYISKNNTFWKQIGSSFTLASTSLGTITDIGFGINASNGAPCTIFLWNLA